MTLHGAEDQMPRHHRLLRIALSVAVALLATAASVGAPTPTTFRSALLAYPPHIDPQRMADFGSYTVTSQIYSTLTILYETLQIVPYAAEKWTVSPDGQPWTFQLRNTIALP